MSRTPDEAKTAAGKIVPISRLKPELNRLRRRGKTVVFTNGCFELLHLGHLRTLQRAKELGDLLVVGLNSDRSVRQIKPGRDWVPERERAELLAALEVVDYVVLFDESTPIRLIEQIRPEIHLKGGDYRPEDLPEAELIRSYGGRVVIAEQVPGRSTSELVERIRGPQTRSETLTPSGGPPILRPDEPDRRAG